MSDTQQFEYKTITHSVKRFLFSERKKKKSTRDLETQLNQLGQFGWELTGQFTQQTNGFTEKVVLVLKRPITANTSWDEEE
jgi:hypothetical protein